MVSTAGSNSFNNRFKTCSTIKATKGEKSIPPKGGINLRNGDNTGLFKVRIKGANGACGLTQLKIASNTSKAIKP